MSRPSFCEAARRNAEASWRRHYGLCVRISVMCQLRYCEISQQYLKAIICMTMCIALESKNVVHIESTRLNKSNHVAYLRAPHESMRPHDGETPHERNR